MADIAAANIGTWTRIGLGNAFLEICKIKGDGTGVTVNVPLRLVSSAWVQAYDDIDGSSKLPIVPGITWATNIITYAAAPTINKYHYLFCIGSD